MSETWILSIILTLLAKHSCSKMLQSSATYQLQWNTMTIQYLITFWSVKDINYSIMIVNKSYYVII